VYGGKPKVRTSFGRGEEKPRKKINNANGQITGREKKPRKLLYII